MLGRVSDQKEERNIFRNLLSVSGIGANTARLILSSLSPGEVTKAIVFWRFRPVRAFQQCLDAPAASRKQKFSEE